MPSSSSTRYERFTNRRQAGVALAKALHRYTGRADVVVLGLPRGGVPVAYEVALALGAPLDVFVVRRLGLPEHPDLEMGAIASGGVQVLNDEVLKWYHLSESAIEAVTRAEQREMERQERAYRGARPLTAIAGRLVVLVDDGLITGSTMRGAVQAVRRLSPLAVVVAVPVGARATCEALRYVADDVVCILTPEPFSAAGLWYDNFDEPADDELQQLLATGAAAPPSRSSG